MIDLPEISLELTNISGLQGKKRSVSSPRDAMFTGNMGQFLVVKGATRRRHKTMAEYRFGEGTFKVDFPTDAEIIRVIKRFPRTGGVDEITSNPRTLVIYEDYHTKEVDVLDVTEYHTLHQHYGFEYKRDEEVWDQLRPGATFSQGTVLSDSPLITPDGDYMFGLEVPTILNSDPAGAEDGFVISDELADAITPTGFGTRTISYGARSYPLNLYGHRDYKIMPDIGERVNGAGVVFASRLYDELLSPVDLSPQSLQHCDFFYDYKVYGEADATVVDIRVERNTNIAGSQMPTDMDQQLLKYYNADRVFYKRILDEYSELRKRRGKRLEISDRFHNLVVESIARVGKEYFRQNQNPWEEIPQKVNMVYRGMPLDEWRVELTFRYNTRPNVGVKLTDSHGASTLAA